MTTAEQIASLQSRINQINTHSVGPARATVSRLQAYGASWALDCREMRIAEATLDNAYVEMHRLRTLLKTLQDSDLQLGACFEALIASDSVGY